MVVNYKLYKTRHSSNGNLTPSSKCGKWPYLFATNVANKKILLDIAVLKARVNTYSWKQTMKTLIKFSAGSFFRICFYLLYFTYWSHVFLAETQKKKFQSKVYFQIFLLLIQFSGNFKCLNLDCNWQS